MEELYAKKKKKVIDCNSWAEVADLYAERLKESPKFKAWLLTKEPYAKIFDARMFQRCYYITHALDAANRDVVTVILGAEGMGKSTLATQIATVVSPSFHLDNYIYEPSQLTGFLKRDEPCGTGIIDEAALLYHTGDIATRDQKTITKLLTICRIKKRHLIFCITDLSLLGKYVREKRVSTIVRIIERGKYQAYNSEGISIIALEGKNKGWKVSSIKIPLKGFWHGDFKNVFPTINDVNFESYLKIKTGNVDEFINDAHSKFGNLSAKNTGGKFYTVTEATQLLRMPPHTLYDNLKSGCIKGVKIGAKWYIEKEAWHKLLDTTEKCGDNPHHTNKIRLSAGVLSKSMGKKDGADPDHHKEERGFNNDSSVA